MSDTKSSMQDDLLATAAHDLKSPIHAVLGLLDLLENSGDLNERQQYYHNRAVNSLNQMQAMISSILDISQIEGESKPVLDTCDLKRIIQDDVELMSGLADERIITIHLAVDSELSEVVGDADQLSRVMNNLLNNALKYNHDQGHVWITAINQPETVQVSVRDSGPGIPLEDQPRIFERFFRSKYHRALKVEGTGLGLSITKAIVEKHQGRIWLESTPDAGTTFIFTLPRKRQLQDGHDLQSRPREIIGEGRDTFNIAQESPIEPSDIVDDNTQEAHGSAESDSSSDLV